MEMNENLLNLIVMVQSYSELKKSERMFCKNEIDPYKETMTYYNSIDDELIKSLGLKKNRIDFEKIYYFEVTEEITGTLYSDLNKFSF